MESKAKPRPQAPQRVRRPAPEVSAAGRWAIYLTIALVVGVIALVGLLVARSTGRARESLPLLKPDTTYRPKPPPEPKVVVSEEQLRKEAEEWRKEYLPPESRPSPRRTLRERIEAEYEAAKRRSDGYLAQGRYGDAIAALERVLDRYDDEELLLRADPEIVELRRQSNRAFKARLAEAEKLAAEGRLAEARKALDAIVAFGIEDFTVQAKEKLAELTAREDAAAAAHFAQVMAEVDAKLPAWQFDEALAALRKLKFDRPQYQKLHASRIQRVEDLLTLKKKIIERIIRGTPRIDKRAFGIPGRPGQLTIADAEFVYSITDAGEEKVPWGRLSAEASARLALAAGNADDSAHRLAVARLLIELGHHARARQELEKARSLGAPTSADEADLAQRSRAE